MTSGVEYLFHNRPNRLEKRNSRHWESNQQKHCYHRVCKILSQLDILVCWNQRYIWLFFPLFYLTVVSRALLDIAPSSYRLGNHFPLLTGLFQNIHKGGFPCSCRKSIQVQLSEKPPRAALFLMFHTAFHPHKPPSHTHHKPDQLMEQQGFCSSEFKQVWQ